MRNAHIIPILKSNKPPDEPKSYRPISLTSCLGKLEERMVNARLYWFLESSNILCHEQAGFRKGREIVIQITGMRHSFRGVKTIRDTNVSA